jgi:hypothetical protein
VVGGVLDDHEWLWVQYRKTGIPKNEVQNFPKLTKVPSNLPQELEAQFEASQASLKAGTQRDTFSFEEGS